MLRVQNDKMSLRGHRPKQSTVCEARIMRIPCLLVATLATLARNDTSHCHVERSETSLWIPHVLFLQGGQGAYLRSSPLSPFDPQPLHALLLG